MTFFDLFTDASTCRSDGGYPPYTVRDEAFQRDFDCIVKDAPNRLFAVEKQNPQWNERVYEKQMK